MRLALFALCVASCALPLQAQPIPRAASLHARASIEAVSVSATATTLLVTLAVDDGWHVSWRNPGDTGLPTRFTWNLPTGVQVRRDTWPVPVVTRSDVGVAHTLEGRVPWLFEFVSDAAPAADRLVRLTIRYGVCREVCIPEQQTVDGVLPAPGSTTAGPRAVSAEVQARLIRDMPTMPARRLASGALCLAGVPPGMQGTAADMILEPGRDIAGAVPGGLERAAGRPTRLVFALPPSAQLRSAGDTVLIVHGGVGLRVPLDFRRPAAAGCRSGA